jgi:hypothetical protein
VIVHHLVEACEHARTIPLPDFTTLPRERLIVHGELLTPDEAKPVGVVLALQTPTREAVDVLLRAGQADLDGPFDVQIYDWQFGGRR